MKKSPLFACIAMLFAVSLAQAQTTGEVSQTNPLGLGWHGCTNTNPLGAADVRFACEAEVTNACRVFRLMPTFVSTITDQGFAGTEVTMDVMIGTSSAVGEWWTGIGPGQCRPVDTLTPSGYISAPSLPTPGACHNVYPSSASTMRGQRLTFANPNRFQMWSWMAVYPEQQLTTGQRTYAMQFDLNTTGTLADCDPAVDSTPVCTQGCSTPACFTLSLVSIYMHVNVQGEDADNTNPDIIHYRHDGGDSRNWATYQGGACGSTLGITPTRLTTWGAIKALYR